MVDQCCWLDGKVLDIGNGIVVGGLICFDNRPLVFIPINFTILDQWPSYSVLL